MTPRPATLRLLPRPASEPPPSEASTAEARAAALSEEALVDGLVAGDPQACDRLYRLYATEVWRMLRRILGDDHELDDLHHEVFVQALRSASRFRREAKLKTWLIGIAVNCARTKLRSRRRRWWLKLMAPEDMPEPASAAADDDDALVARAVYDLVARLPTEERIAFTLRFVEGMSNGEVAEAMACSSGTVKRRLARANSRFFALAQDHPALASLCDEEDRS